MYLALGRRHPQRLRRGTPDRGLDVVVTGPPRALPATARKSDASTSVLASTRLQASTSRGLAHVESVSARDTGYPSSTRDSVSLDAERVAVSGTIATLGEVDRQ